jgi:hypothetical protein
MEILSRTDYTSSNKNALQERSMTERPPRSPAEKTSANRSSAEPSDARSIEELDAAIGRLARRMNADTYRLLVLIREFDDRFGWAKWTFRNCAAWLAWRCGLSDSAAREKVRVARALPLMPLIAEAFADGRLSYSKVRALTRVAEAHDEDLLLGYALQATAAEVEERCRQIRYGSPESASRALRTWHRRSLTLWHNEARGLTTISVEVPIEEGELIAQALERAVAAGEAAIGIEFAEPRDAVRDALRHPEEPPASRGDGWRAQQADALVAIARAYLSGVSRGRGGEAEIGGEDAGTLGREAETSGTEAEEGAAPRPAADHYQVVVHVDESALRGGAGRADLPIDIIKRLTCDGSLIAIVEDEHATPVAVSRKRRTVSTALRRALWARDRGCTFPGCRDHKRFIDAHHIRHWANGGETSLDNTTLLCFHHHRLLHEGRFHIRRDEGGTLRFHRADGRAIPRHGYRLEDMRDDFVADDRDAVENASAEGWAAPPETPRARDEVRECAPPYGVVHVEGERDDIDRDGRGASVARPHALSPGNSPLRPLAMNSTAIAARIRPSMRVMTLSAAELRRLAMMGARRNTPHRIRHSSTISPPMME